MIDPAQIPDEVAEAAAKVEYEVWRHDCAGELDLDLEMYRLWDQLEPYEQERWCDQSRAAIAAALNAWQGIQGAWYEGDTPTAYIIPLPQKKQND